jgi:hypothetical protein
MKRHLLAAVAALALSAAPAAAQVIVHDPKSDQQRMVEAIRAIEEAMRRYRMLQATYQALSGARDIQGVAAALGTPVRTYMPQGAIVTDLIAGSRSPWGTATRLMNMARYRDVGRDTVWAREMQRREIATANARAIADAGLQSSQQSLEGLGGLLARLSGSNDVNEAVAANGAVAVEQQNLAHHQQQLQQVQLMLHTEDRTDRQRAEQMRYESALELYENTRPFGSVQ